MVTSLREWDAYPLLYRAEAAAEIAHWLQDRESGAVVGLPGVGKSNFLGFLCHRPQALSRHWDNWQGKLILAMVDLNNLPDYEFATVYRGILRALYEGRARWYPLEPSLPALVETHYRNVLTQTEPFVVQSALREVLLYLKQQDIHLVLVCDPFDRFSQSVSIQVLDSLRGLRDSFKSRLSYIVGLRRKITYDSDTTITGELYELLDSHTLWLQPMTFEDARWVIKQIEAAVGFIFNEEWSTHLITLTGGYPALLKTAGLWLSKQSTLPDIQEWDTLLLAETSIQNRLWDIWHGLTNEEQSILILVHTFQNLANHKEATKKLEQLELEIEQTHVLKSLHQHGILSTDWQYFSPLFADFLAQIKGVARGRIWHNPQTDCFFLGETELVTLSEQDRRLLRHFIKYPKVIHTIDDLIEAVWVDYDSGGVSSSAVQQAIRHLREKIEVDPSNPCYLITQHRVGYRFFPEGVS